MNTNSRGSLANSDSSTSTPPSKRASLNSNSNRLSTANNGSRLSMRNATAPQAPHCPASNIKVYVRCRSRNQREVKENSDVVVSTQGIKGKEVILKHGNTTKTYTFDGVLGAESDQESVYDGVAKDVLDDMLKGYNCTIFAYGQTGTGKTYTMSGDLQTNINGKLTEEAGIMPRVLFDLFGRLSKVPEYSVKVSFIELYNEDIIDLLSEDDGRLLKIYDDTNNKRSVVIHGMDEVYIKTPEEGLDLVKLGSNKRKVATTKCNDRSSRSHSVFTITVHMKIQDPIRTKTEEEFVTVGKLNLVDLAGSENISRSGATNKRAREAGMINQSLLTLGRVINSLVENSLHIPYRESKLTRLLQDSLGGQTKTRIIATLSPAKVSLDETISTLEYAHTAKSIKNRPQVNQALNKKLLISEYIEEIEKLKRDLAATRSQGGVYLDKENYDHIRAESESRRIRVEELELRVGGQDDKIGKLHTKYDKLEHEMNEVQKSMEAKSIELECVKLSLIEKEKEVQLQTKLRKAHQDTEVKLREICGDLQKKVVIAINTFEDFHDIIIKQNSVMGSQQDHLQSKESELSKNLLALKSSLASLSQKFETEFKVPYKSMLQGYDTARRENLSGLISELEQVKSEFIKNNSGIENAVKEFSASFKTIVNDGLTDITSEIAKINQSDLNNMKTELDSSKVAILDDLNLIKNYFEISLSKFADQCNDTISSFKASVFEQSQRLKGFQADAEKSNREMLSLFDTLNNFTLTQMKSEEEKQREIECELLDLIQSKLKSISKDRDQRLSSLFQVLNSKKNNLQTVHANAFISSMSNFSNALSQNSVSQDNHLSQISNLLDTVGTEKDTMQTEFTAFDTKISDLYNSKMVSLDKLTQKMNENLKLLEVYVQDLQNQSESHNEYLITKVDDTKTLVSGKVAELKSMVTQLQENCSSELTESLAKVDAACEIIVGSVNSNVSDLVFSISLLKKCIEEYVGLGKSTKDLVPALPKYEKTFDKLPVTNTDEITAGSSTINVKKRKLDEVYKDNGSSNKMRVNSSGSCISSNSLIDEDQENVPVSAGTKTIFKTKSDPNIGRTLKQHGHALKQKSSNK
ncbi:unnamed protein product [Ambrosiozyma monospora]|uniref:Kinesin-like protein KIP1 n=1 Tax=Ambrosiozyma monospora TaxID=43982 RepID=A0A9W7DCZ7_AMBMO|nr:unnamed protein product [Ambrosiozyma monospora]